jgi:DNA-binding CsgD family transcriptional regulator
MDGLSSRPLIDESQKQVVLDAAAALQVRRSEVAAALARGPVPDAEIIADGHDHATLNGRLTAQFDRWQELLSVRTWATVENLRFSLPNNRMLLDRGLRMSSIFDAHGVGLGALLLLANEPVGGYLVSFAPVTMKIVNRNSVMLQGPETEDGAHTVMTVRSAACLEAAWRYWEAVRRYAVPAGDRIGVLSDLTPRQRQVVALMADGLGDDAIATAIGVSTRTVRSDIAALLDLLGVRTRFAAGVRLRLWPDTSG